MNVTETSQKMKNKSMLSIEKNILEQEKTRIMRIIIRRYFNLKNCASL